MDSFIYIILLLGDLVFLLFIFLLVKKGLLSVRLSLTWFALGGALLVFAAFPILPKIMREVFHFEVVANFVFTFLFCFVLIVLLVLSAVASKQSETIKRLAQSIALLEKRVRALEDSAPKNG